MKCWPLSFSDSNNSGSGSGSGSGSSDSDSGSQSGSGSSGSSSQSENGNEGVVDDGQAQTENLSDSQDGFGRVTKTAIIKDVAKVCWFFGSRFRMGFQGYIVMGKITNYPAARTYPPYPITICYMASSQHSTSAIQICCGYIGQVM